MSEVGSVITNPNIARDGAAVGDHHPAHDGELGEQNFVRFTACRRRGVRPHTAAPPPALAAAALRRGRVALAVARSCANLRAVAAARQLLFLAGLLACNTSGETTTGFTTPGTTTPGVTTPPDDTGGSSSSAGSSSTSSSSSGAEESSVGGSSSGGMIWDMGQPDFGGSPVGCKGKIDFLFVISSSGTMFDQQKLLLAAYPDFMAAIEAEFPDFDRHILVTDGDDFYQMKDCSLCADPDDCDPASMEKSCGIPLDTCDKKLGAGVVFPIGVNASNRRCDLADGHRYITNADPDPLAAFECIAQVGTGGDGELSAEAMLAALQPDLNGPGRCNEGFLRDDALLVVTIIRDTGDVFSQGEPEDWLDGLYWSKGDNEDAVFVLVITTDADIYPSLCFPNEPPHALGRLRTFVDLVEHGYIGSICAESYGPFFAEAVAQIGPLCDGLIPQ